MKKITTNCLKVKKRILSANFFLYIALLVFFTFSKVTAQTPGLIYEPATGVSRNVLDPDLNGYTSRTIAGFIGDDQTDSELAYTSLVFPMVELTGDLSAGPVCGFTDFADQGDQDPVQSFLSGGNWRFRMRMANSAANAKSYSILIDTDGKFGASGPNRDLQYSSANPGFEIELVLATRFGVYIYDVNNMNCTPVKAYEDPLNIHYQKSIALTTACGDPDYFYDFYVEFSDLNALFGITPSTPVRMAMITNMGAKKSSLCSPASASDIAGINTACGSLANCLEIIINNYTPCAPGTSCFDRSLCPGINSINSGATTVTGTSSEANGTVIAVYKDGLLIGSTTVTSGVWTLSSITPALIVGNVITATATAPIKGTSIDNCDIETVGFTCDTRTIPTGVTTIISGRKGAQGTAVPRPIGTIITFYNANGTPNTDPGLSANPFITTAASQAWTIGIGTGNSLADGSYYVTFQSPGQCPSTAVWLCSFNGGSPGNTLTPVITTTPLLPSTTTISGTGEINSYVTLEVTRVSDGFIKTIARTQINASGNWTISGLALESCYQVNVRAALPTKCVSTTATASIQSPQASAPTVNAPICSTSAITTVTGTSAEATGTIIQVYDNGVATGPTTTVSPTRTWTATGLNIALGRTITARASGTCLSISADSNAVIAGTKTSNIPSITGSTLNECAPSVSGTGTTGDVITLFIDGIQIGTATTVASGAWTIAGLALNCDLYSGGIVTAKATTGSNCEGNASAGVNVVCVNPVNNQIVTPVSTIICSGETVSVSVQSSENGIVYQLFNGGTKTGSSKLGNGGTIVLISDPLTSNTTLTVKAIKIGTACSVDLTNSVSVTVKPLPSSAIAESLGIITATQNSASYQWYSCPNTLIPGAINQSYTPISSGDYKAEITVNGCTVTSSCITVTTLSTIDFENTSFSYYPNPTSGIFNINNSAVITKIQVNTILGQEVLVKNTNLKNIELNLDFLPLGTYLVRVFSEDKIKTIKVVKQ